MLNDHDELTSLYLYELKRRGVRPAELVVTPGVGKRARQPRVIGVSD